MNDAFVSARGISKDFTHKMTYVEAVLARFGADYHDQTVRAVANVNLEIQQGQILGLVGESGCGKSTLGRILAGLIPQTRGEVHLGGKPFDIQSKSLSVREKLRTQMVFQNPMASLNPRQKVIDIVTEGPLYHGLISGREKVKFATDLLNEVGLAPEMMYRLPHQFSGGQRQRIGIARALSTKPEFLICDEPVAALDVSIQAQIINLLARLRKSHNLTILFISHDLSVVRHLCDDVAVMYLGSIVEAAPVDALFAKAHHPYTRALLAEMPSIDAGRREFEPIKGEIPSPLDPPSGCHFHPRCPLADDQCQKQRPELKGMEAKRDVACFHAELHAEQVA